MNKINIFSIRRSILYKENSYMMNLAINRSARKLLKVVEEEKGRLSKELKFECDNYAIDVLGHKKYAPWLYVYSAMNGEFKEGWISENYYYDYIVRGLDEIYHKQSEVKPLTAKILSTNKLPDLLYVSNGLFIDPLNYSVISKSYATDLLFGESEEVIFKSNNSNQGRGIVFFNKKSWEEYSFTKESGVFQKIIKQHEFFNKIFPYPGATIRITTALNPDGKASARAAYLRLGRNNSDSLGTHVMSSSAVKVAIDMDSGELFKSGHLANMRSTLSHPDTQVAFEGLVIPAFNKACKVVEKLHNHFPFVHCIGWDIIINNQEEVEIMEWNTANNSITYHEAINGPCFSDLISFSRI